MANLGNVSVLNINGNQVTIKDPVLTEVVNEIIEAIGANNGNISEHINDLHNRAFDALIKISSQNESEIASIQDGIYKLQYVTITGEGDEETETLNNSAILIQKGTNQYLYKDGQISSRTKTNNTWGSWTVDSHPVTSVNGQTGIVSLSKSNIGLGNVDNTSDTDKPISTATQMALNNKANNTLSSSYQTPTKVQELVSPISGDTLEAAIQKLNNGIVDDEELWATVLTNLESRITTLQNNVSLPSEYSASSGTNNELIPASGDSLITAISKLHKAVLDLESMYSSLYNDLNTRLTALET